MKKTPLLFTFILFLFTIVAQNNFNPVSGADLITIKNSIRDKNAQIQTLICPFVQTKKMAVLKENDLSKGIMYFVKANKFRWEYTGEKSFVFVQNGDKYYTKINGKVSEIKDNSARLFQEISKLVISSINGDILENTKKFKTEYEDNSDTFVVHLMPVQKAMQNFISKIKLYFNKSNYLVAKIEIYEIGEDTTTIQFENVKVNQPINQTVFELK
jgi:outer membrane lipoprotein-sorting protein